MVLVTCCPISWVEKVQKGAKFDLKISVQCSQFWNFHLSDMVFNIAFTFITTDVSKCGVTQSVLEQNNTVHAPITDVVVMEFYP